MVFQTIDNETDYEILGSMFLQWKKAKSVELDKISRVILRYFIFDGYGSAYKIHKFLNEEKKIKIAYKNVHQKIKKLSSLNIITIGTPTGKTVDSDPHKNSIEDISIKNIHGAKYYQISPFGIFYIYVKEIVSSVSIKEYKSIFSNYEDFFLYENMMFNIIPLEAIKQLQSDLVWDPISSYIHNYFNIMENMFEYFDKQDFVIESIKNIKGLINPFAFHPNPAINENHYLDYPILLSICKRLGRPSISIEEKKIK